MATLLQRLLSGGEQRHSIQTVDDFFTYQGHQYPTGVNTTWTRAAEEAAPAGFEAVALQMFAANPVVFAVENTRMSVFAEARFQYRRFQDGRPQDLFGDASLRMFERPWPGGTTGDLLSRMLLTADLAGNAYVLKINGRLKVLNPSKVTILLGSRLESDDPNNAEDVEVVGYGYTASRMSDTRIYAPDQVAHFAPQPDPTANFRGMSWLTPVVREVQSDKLATEHKYRYFINGATPNLVVRFDPSTTMEQAKQFKQLFEDGHAGAANAYKTLYLAGGADATVVGADLAAMDFARIQGKAETRIAMAGGVHPVILGASEGLSGSSLNAGNYSTAKRLFADRTLRPLWRNAAASLGVLVTPPTGAELWYDDRDIPFLSDDLSDTADIQAKQATAMRQLVDGGYDPQSVIDAIAADDMKRLTHTGNVSVQLQPAGQAPTQEPRARTVERDEDGRIVRIVEAS